MKIDNYAKEIMPMSKRIITLLLMTFMLIPLLSGCFSEPEERSTPDTSDITPESSEKYDEPVLKSFYATEARWAQGYVVFDPLENSEEFENWDVLYVNRFIDGDPCPGLNEGEVVEIVYSGEIEPKEKERIGFIENVHAITIKNNPRNYDGVDYGVAIMREAISSTKIDSISGDNTEKGMIVLTSFDELDSLVGDAFLGQMVMDEPLTDIQKDSLSRVNSRHRLLDGYDEEFFEKNDLLIKSLRLGSGSLRFEVTDISVESGVCTVTYEFTNRPITCDMADWIIFVAVPKELSAQIKEYKTYLSKPDWYP